MKVKELSENLSLEENEFLDLAKLLAETSAAKLIEFGNALKTGDKENVFSASHFLKGSAGSLCFQDMYEPAKFIEINLRKGFLEGSKGALTSLKEKLAQPEENLKKIMG